LSWERGPLGSLAVAYPTVAGRAPIAGVHHRALSSDGDGRPADPRQQHLTAAIAATKRFRVGIAWARLAVVGPPSGGWRIYGGGPNTAWRAPLGLQQPVRFPLGSGRARIRWRKWGRVGVR
jgi:hypothetical protein